MTMYSLLWINIILLTNYYSRLLYFAIHRTDLKKNWFAAIKFRDLNLDYLKNIIAKTFEDWFAAKNIPNDKAFVNLAKNSRTWIKVGLQYMEHLFINYANYQK